MLALSALSLALASSDAALYISKRQTNGLTIPESCESVCTVLGQVTIGTIYGDVIPTCSDTISSQFSTCLACAVNADPSAFTADLHDNVQTNLEDYVAACSAAGVTITPPVLNDPTSDESSGAESSTDAASATTTTTKTTDTLTRAATTDTHSASSTLRSAPAPASPSSTGAAVNLKVPIEIAAAIAFVFAFLV